MHKKHLVNLDKSIWICYFDQGGLFIEKVGDYLIGHFNK